MMQHKTKLVLISLRLSIGFKAEESEVGKEETIGISCCEWEKI